MKHDRVPIADCLNRNVQAKTALEDESINVTVMAISLFQEGMINQIKREMAKDLILVELAKTIQSGWPAQRTELSHNLHIFWIHRLNMSLIDGVIMNGARIVIPTVLRDEYLRCPHTGHFGISKSQARAKSTEY